MVGLALPPWVRDMARRNSPMLNMPDRERFRQLPTEGRLRVVGAVTAGLQRLSLWLVALFGWILYSSNEVAHGRWQTAPPWGVFGFVGLVLAQAIWMVAASSRAVRRELDAAA